MYLLLHFKRPPSIGGDGEVGYCKKPIWWLVWRLSVDLLSSPGVEPGQREAEGLRHLRLCRQELPGGGEEGRG